MKADSKRKMLHRLIVLLLSLVLLLSSCGSATYSDIEKKAVKFAESMFDSDFEYYADIISSYILAVETMKTYTSSPKVLAEFYRDYYSFDKYVVDDLGEKWKYSIEVVDTYEFTEGMNDYDYINDNWLHDSDAVVVTLNITFSGKKWFKKVSQSERLDIYFIEENDEQVVGYYCFNNSIYMDNWIEYLQSIK